MQNKPNSPRFCVKNGYLEEKQTQFKAKQTQSNPIFRPLYLAHAAYSPQLKPVSQSDFNKIINYQQSIINHFPPPPYLFFINCPAAHRGICVNTLSPGVIGNEFTEKTMSSDVMKTMQSLILLGRLAKVEEMVGAAIFLASEESSFVTAQTIAVNGGAWAR